jgi:hypothetical protein
MDGKHPLVLGVDLNRSESYWLRESLRNSPVSETTGYHVLLLLSGEPRNEILDELRGVFRLISRREPLDTCRRIPARRGYFPHKSPHPCRTVRCTSPSTISNEAMTKSLGMSSPVFPCDGP